MKIELSELIQALIDDIKPIPVTQIKSMPSIINNGMIGKYVIVRCKDAGVHAGILIEHAGRECVLKNSRRLWYWKPADGAAFLSGVATQGLHLNSKIGAVLDRIHLTENCEIIKCSSKAAKSIQDIKAYETN